MVRQLFKQLPEKRAQTQNPPPKRKKTAKIQAQHTVLETRCQRPKKKSQPKTRFKPQTKKTTQSNPFQKLLTYRPTLLFVEKILPQKATSESRNFPPRKSRNLKISEKTKPKNSQRQTKPKLHGEFFLKK
jgi:hypothetical protein